MSRADSYLRRRRSPRPIFEPELEPEEPEKPKPTGDLVSQGVRTERAPRRQLTPDELIRASLGKGGWRSII